MKQEIVELIYDGIVIKEFNSIGDAYDYAKNQKYRCYALRGRLVEKIKKEKK